MGANRVGEIAQLSGIANPTHGLITNIGHAHTETFGGIEGVIRGKSELFDHLRKNGGQVFINTEDPVLSNMAKRFDDPVLYPGSDVKLADTTPNLIIEMNGQRVETRQVGTYNFSNISAAIALGRYFTVPDDDIAEAIATYEPDNWRSQFVKKGDVSVILDAYNANPSSMKLAIENLAGFSGRKVAILGGMEEVQDSEKAHLDVADQLREHGIDAVLLLGDRTKVIHEKVEGSEWFAEKDGLEDYLENNKLKECTVLIKASRAANMETLINHI